MRVETTPFAGRPPAVGLRCWSVWRCLDSPRPTRLSADRRRSRARQRSRIPIHPHRRFGTLSPRRLRPRRRLLLRRRMSRPLRLRCGKRGRRSAMSWSSISTGSRSARTRSLRRPPEQLWYSSRNDQAARTSSAPRSPSSPGTKPSRRRLGSNSSSR